MATDLTSPSPVSAIGLSVTDVEFDARSGDVADPFEPAESADDPDEDGRVQVP